MKRTFVFLVCSVLPLFANTIAIPNPVDSAAGGYIVQSRTLGDFDGDSSDDILVFWSNLSSSSSKMFGVFSAKKMTYLFSGGFNNLYDSTIIPIGDFLDNGKKAFVFEGKLYAFNPGDVSIKKIISSAKVVKPTIKHCNDLLLVDQINRNVRISIINLKGKLYLKKSPPNYPIKLTYPPGIYVVVIEDSHCLIIDKMELHK
jgi:hypothetical protein